MNEEPATGAPQLGGWDDSLFDCPAWAAMARRGSAELLRRIRAHEARKAAR